MPKTALARAVVVAIVAAAALPVTQAVGAAAPPTRAALAAGKRIFIANCSGCHTLRAAHSTGIVGPDLDRYRPSVAQAVAQVTHGGAPMPAFAGGLTKKQILEVAEFVHADR